MNEREVTRFVIYSSDISQQFSLNTVSCHDISLDNDSCDSVSLDEVDEDFESVNFEQDSE